MTSIHNLATTYDMLGRYDHAEPLYLEALEGKTRALGASHPTRILTVVRLVAMYERNRRFAESEALLMGVVQTLGLDRMTGDAGKSAPFRVQERRSISWRRSRSSMTRGANR